MAFKINYFFTMQSELTAGWSMTFWNAAADFASAITRAFNLSAHLNAITGDGVQVVGARIAEIGQFRRVQNVNYNYGVTTATRGSAFDPDGPTAALLIEYRKEDATKVYLTRQWLRGIADSQIQGQGRMFRNGVYIARFNAFLAHLTTSINGWSMWVQDKDQPEVDVTDATNAGIITAPGHAFGVTTPLTRVRIKNASKFRYLNRIWKVSAAAGNTFQVAFFDPLRVPPADLGNPKVIKQVKKLVAIETANLIRATKHNTGRPSRTYSGRRRRIPV